MSGFTRRSVLCGVTGVAVTLAGCNTLSGSASESGTVTEGRISNTGDDSTVDPETLQVRTDTDRPPVWLAQQDGEGGRPEARDEHRHFEALVVDTTARAERITVADSVDRDRVESFVDATDFDAETIYIETTRIKECFRLELCGVSWQADKVSTDYTRLNRPYTERCTEHAHVFEVFLIRIPDTLDADSVNSHSTSIGTGGCPSGPRIEAGGESESGSTTPSGGGE